MKEARIALVVCLIFFGSVVGTYFWGRSTVHCPEPIVSWERLRELQAVEARYDSVETLLTTILSAASDAHDEHVREINSRPDDKQRFNDAYTTSPNADAARAKWRDVLMRRPERYDSLGTDSAGHLLPVDPVR